MKYKRSLRVSELIKREVSVIIAEEVKDPWVKNITITFVKLTDDLKHAKIYYRILGEDPPREHAAIGLERANKYIRGEIGQRASLRYVPEIQFIYDIGLDDASHIDMLLQQLKNDQDV